MRLPPPCVEQITCIKPSLCLPVAFACAFGGRGSKNILHCATKGTNLKNFSFIMIAMSH